MPTQHDSLVQVHGHSVVDDTLMPYPIYWGMSVNDWYWASGDTARFLFLAPDVGSIIDQAVSRCRLECVPHRFVRRVTHGLGAHEVSSVVPCAHPTALLQTASLNHCHGPDGCFETLPGSYSLGSPLSGLGGTTASPMAFAARATWRCAVANTVSAIRAGIRSGCARSVFCTRAS
jgi:hypothetical protein